MSARRIYESAQRPGIPGFTVLEVLARGGSAVVYLARQDELDRLVALKVIRQPIDDPGAWREFEREIKAVARLSGHPNVVAIYTTGRTATGEPFVVTEYADRGSLADVLASQGPLPVHEAVTVGLGVTDALAAAHAVGIIHRGVKPGNVLLTSNGGVKLADFGIARLLPGTSPMTTGMTAFRSEHVAPGVLQGKAAGEAADVYGLASTITEALTARPPCGTIRSGEPVAALTTTNLGTDIAPLPAAMPPRLRAALTTVLVADVQRRPGLGVLRYALKNAAQECAVTAAAVTAPQPKPEVLTDLGPSRRRQRTIASVAAAAALVALLIGAVIAVTRRDGRSTPARSADSTAAPARITATPTIAARVTASPTTLAPGPAAPTAAPPTGTGPATPAPTTAARTVPTIASPVAPPAAAAAPPVDRARLAESFLRLYYSTVAARDYELAWSMLTPEFQMTTGGYDDYTSFWDTVERVEVRRVEVRSTPGAPTWPIVATLGMRYTVDGRVVDENDQLTLAPDTTGAPLIAGYRVIGGA
jgi:hypothetical protein